MVTSPSVDTSILSIPANNMMAIAFKGAKLRRQGFGVPEQDILHASSPLGPSDVLNIFETVLAAKIFDCAFEELQDHRKCMLNSSELES